MKALTVYQPWATLVMIGAKPFEFRKWDYRSRNPGLEGQRIVIHASAREIRPVEVEDILQRIADGESALKDELALPLLQRVREAYRCRGVLELAAGLGTAVIGRPRRVTDIFKGTPHDSDRLDQSVFGWPLTDIQPFPEPVPCRGLQGFWTWPHALELANR